MLIATQLLQLLFTSSLVAGVISGGNLVLRIISEVTCVIHLEACLHYEPCKDVKWSVVKLPKVISNNTLVYEHHYVLPTVPNGSLLLSVNDEKDQDVIFPETEFKFLLNRRAYKFSFTTNNGHQIDIEVENVCDYGFFRDGCSVYCESPKPGTNFYCDYDIGRTCKPGWEGYVCEQPVCESKCNLQGVCMAPNKCLCFRGYGGDDCSECVPSETCKNGKCLVIGEHIFPDTCQCIHGWYGSDCDEVDICYHARPCRHGTCKPTNSTIYNFECTCDKGYAGVRCDSLPSKFDCSMVDPCKNGGECVQFDNRSRCRCQIGFGGRKCEIATGAIIPTTPTETRPPISANMKITSSTGTTSTISPVFSPSSTSSMVTSNSPKNSDCTVDHCRNGGKCVQLPHKTGCRCPIGFGGKLCEIATGATTPTTLTETSPPSSTSMPTTTSTAMTPISSTVYPSPVPVPTTTPSSPKQTDCSLPEYCKNGGKCIQLFLDTECRCPVGFTGETCEISTEAVISTKPNEDTSFTSPQTTELDATPYPISSSTPYPLSSLPRYPFPSSTSLPTPMSSHRTSYDTTPTPPTEIPCSTLKPTSAKRDCTTRRCRDGFVCVMDRNRPICINRVIAGPMVTMKHNDSCVVYKIYYGVHHWRMKTTPKDFRKEIKNAVNEDDVEIWAVKDEVSFREEEE